MLAAAFAREQPYHVVVLDLNLPDVGGLQVLEVLRKVEEQFCEPGVRLTRI